jgi:hypothetical protein
VIGPWFGRNSTQPMSERRTIGRLASRPQSPASTEHSDGVRAGCPERLHARGMTELDEHLSAICDRLGMSAKARQLPGELRPSLKTMSEHDGQRIKMRAGSALLSAESDVGPGHAVAQIDGVWLTQRCAPGRPACRSSRWLRISSY